MAATTEQLARRVCDSWTSFTAHDYNEVFAEDCQYQNMPMSGVNVGPEAIQTVLGLMGDGYEVKLRIDNLVAGPDMVMIERTESFTRRDGSGSFELPVIGVFEDTAGKITAWRDYFQFDPKQWGVKEA
jgi:limonene-1,2-epoxide hydrolase